MEPRVITSMDQLRICLQHIMEADKDFAEMYDSFFCGNATKSFFIYDMTLETGGVERTIDYSLNSGGGWLNVGMPFEEFVRSINTILDNWPLSKEVAEEVAAELSKLVEFSKK